MSTLYIVVKDNDICKIIYATIIFYNQSSNIHYIST